MVMPDQKNSTIHSIQYLRAIAALLVVFHHSLIQIDAYTHTLQFTRVGVSGVDIFFVISGFIIWYVTSRSTIGTFDFLMRRIIRVAPIYWFVTLLIVLAAIFMPHLFKSTQFGASEIVKSLLFIPHYNLAFPEHVYPILVPGWTLNYEMFFYLLFSLILFFKMRFAALLLLFAALIFTGLVYKSQNPIFLTYTNTLLVEFVIGALIAKYALSNSARTFSPIFAWGLIALGFILLKLSADMMEVGAYRGFYSGPPAALIVFGAVMLERSAGLPKFKFFHLLGDASYSIYLTHVLSLGVFRKIWLTVVPINSSIVEMTFFVILSLLFSTLIGVCVYLMVEKPLLKMLKALLARRGKMQTA